jgi:hypothetical protein
LAAGDGLPDVRLAVIAARTFSVFIPFLTVAPFPTPDRPAELLLTAADCLAVAGGAFLAGAEGAAEDLAAACFAGGAVRPCPSAPLGGLPSRALLSTALLSRVLGNGLLGDGLFVDGLSVEGLFVDGLLGDGVWRGWGAGFATTAGAGLALACGFEPGCSAACFAAGCFTPGCSETGGLGADFGAPWTGPVAFAAGAVGSARAGAGASDGFSAWWAAFPCGWRATRTKTSARC